MATGLAILHKMRSSLTSMLKTWANVLTTPSDQTFAAEQSKSSATLSTALAWTLLASIIALLLVFLRMTLTEMWVLPPHEMEWHQPSNFIIEILHSIAMLKTWLFTLRSKVAGGHSILWFHFGSLPDGAFEFELLVTHFLPDTPNRRWIMAIGISMLSPVFFLGTVGIYHYIATLVGGRGQFGHYVYLVAAFSAPIAIAKSLLYFLPLAVLSLTAVLPGTSLTVVQSWYYWVSFPFAFGITVIPAVYWLALIYFATKVEHGLTGVRTIVGISVASLLVFVLRNSLQLALMGLYDAMKLIRQ